MSRPTKPSDRTPDPELAAVADPEAFLRRLIAASPDCVKVLDLDASLLSMSENGRNALEIDDLTTHLGTCWTNWWSGADHEQAAAAVADAKAGRTGRFEAEAVTPKGTRKWWDVTVTAIPGPDGRPAKLLTVSREVTAQRADRDAAAERLNRLRSVIESAKDYAVISVDPGGTIDGWSGGATDTFGWAEAEAVGRSFDLIWTAEDRAADHPANELRTARDNGMCPDTRWHVRADGRRIFVVGACRPVRDDAGKLAGYVKVCRDETDARGTAEALADARRRLDAALVGGRIATWVWDVGADRLFGDRNMFALFDVPEDPRGLPVAAYAEAVHPDDRPGVMAALDRAVRTGEDYVAEYRTVTDPPRWLYARAQVERRPDTETDRLAGVVLDVTDRRETEAALRESEARFRQIADAMPQIVWTARPDGWLDYYNRRWHEYTGLPEGGGGDASWEPAMLPVDLPRIHHAWGEAVRTGQPYDVEYRVRRAADGAYRWHVARAMPVRDADGNVARWVGTITDIDDQKAAAEASRVGEARLAAALAVADLGTFEWDLRADAVAADAQARSLFGFDPAAPLSAADFFNSIDPAEVDRVRAETQAAVESGLPTAIEYDIRLPDGTTRRISSGGRVARGVDGRPERMYGVFADATERRRAEADREHLLGVERAARAEAEQAGKMKDEFLATLSHELRTPLTAIVGWTQILRGPGNGPDDYAEGLAVIDRNARAQTQIIEDILDMSRIVAGKVRLDVQRVDVAAVVRAGADTVRPAADAKGVRLEVVVDPLAATVSGDPGRLHQVFWNLVSNAVKFTPKGGRVQVTLERVNSHVEASVVDTGDGIDPAFLPYVFDRFRQADASTTRKHGGLGLGLAIVKQLVELHGGSVRVKSPGKGRGSTFVVALPLAVVHPEPDEPAAAAREHPHAEVPVGGYPLASDQLRGVDVLVVDDEPDGRVVVKRLLEGCHATVRTAGSAAEAMRLIGESVPDVLVSDIGMPGEDGYALIRRVRTMDPAAGGRVPAVALTAYARAADRIQAMAAGFQMHLSKPVEPAELVVTVATLAKAARSETR